MTLRPETAGRPLATVIIPVGIELQAVLERRPADAREEAADLAARWGELAATDRIRVIGLQLAGYEFHSAVLNWSHLDSAGRSAAEEVLVGGTWRRPAKPRRIALMGPGLCGSMGGQADRTEGGGADKIGDRAMTPEQAAAVLEALGVNVSPGDIVVERRDERWFVRTSADSCAWIAASDRGRDMLTRERRLLQLLSARVDFHVPRVLAVSADGSAEVRTLVPGTVDAASVFRRVIHDQAAARHLGQRLGEVLAELHSQALATEVRDWLPNTPAWPLSRLHVAERLPQVIDDPVLVARADLVLQRYADASSSLDAGMRRLVHGDLGFHNMAFGSGGVALEGIFDWEEACWADPHLDFRYLAADLEHWTLFDAACAEYEANGGCRIERDRVILYNAAWAVSYLAFRAGVAPEVRWCGRTLSEDLAWSRRAVDLVAGR